MECEIYDMPLFRGGDRTRMETILQKSPGRYASYQKGDFIALQHSACRSLLLLCEGSVYAQMTSSEGRELTLDTLSAPDTLASAFIFGTENRYPVSIIANSDCRLWVVGRESILQIIEQDNAVVRSARSIDRDIGIADIDADILVLEYDRAEIGAAAGRIRIIRRNGRTVDRHGRAGRTRPVAVIIIVHIQSGIPGKGAVFYGELDRVIRHDRITGSARLQRAVGQLDADGARLRAVPADGKRAVVAACPGRIERHRIQNERKIPARDGKQIRLRDRALHGEIGDPHLDVVGHGRAADDLKRLLYGRRGQSIILSVDLDIFSALDRGSVERHALGQIYIFQQFDRRRDVAGRIAFRRVDRLLQRIIIMIAALVYRCDRIGGLFIACSFRRARKRRRKQDRKRDEYRRESRTEQYKNALPSG